MVFCIYISYSKVHTNFISIFTASSLLSQKQKELQYVQHTLHDSQHNVKKKNKEQLLDFLTVQFYLVSKSLDTSFLFPPKTSRFIP